MSEDDVVIAEYQQALLERPHVVARRRSPTGFKNQITEAHLNMNNKWGKVAFDQGTFSYSIVEPCLRVDSIPKRRHTGCNPSKEDLTLYEWYIDQTTLSGKIVVDLTNQSAKYDLTERTFRFDRFQRARAVHCARIQICYAEFCSDKLCNRTLSCARRTVYSYIYHRYIIL